MSENPELQKEIIRSEIDFEQCDAKSLWQAYSQGKLEWESFSPYAANYDLSSQADIVRYFEEYNIKSDLIGIAIAKKLKELFPEARMISLYDEYNTQPGRDVKGEFIGPAEMSEAGKENFKVNVEKLLRDEGVIKEGDVAEKNYFLISESSKTEDAEELVRRLEDEIAEGKVKGSLVYGLVEGEASNTLSAKKLEQLKAETESQITFITAGGKKIRLRDKYNHWICEALDASSYLKPENQELTHLVILPESFREQQANVRELLNCLGIEMKNYHNIFFKEDLPPDAVAEVIREEIEKTK